MDIPSTFRYYQNGYCFLKLWALTPIFPLEARRGRPLGESRGRAPWPDKPFFGGTRTPTGVLVYLVYQTKINKNYRRRFKNGFGRKIPAGSRLRHASAQ